MIDCTSLLCLTLTSVHIKRRVRSIGEQTLNVKYQLRETSEITSVMLQCGVISLLTKLCAMFIAWTVVYHIFSEKYAFTIAAGGYLLLETVNCFTCCWALLLNHRGLRRHVMRLIGRDIPISPNSNLSDSSVRDLYFNDLHKAWN
ncbi:hypothetical protein PENTCL1PPCAC_17064 [Pristionchus entomophagus]|uniref:G protein-coupled receptor n=1 Tax=Pristionchus entomophagus TaxID=358040 RepID=A0AAV5TKL9_9BILA|nr:hypothetical protein PENTCL1PPCAC_17064 [Pristionchus entomophagus]